MNVPLLFGVFEDGLWQAEPEAFDATCADLEAHAMNAIWFTNSSPNLSVSDKTNVKVVAAPDKSAGNTATTLTAIQIA